jgi:hypothetical protein
MPLASLGPTPQDRAQKKAAAKAAAVHREETPRKGSSVRDATPTVYTLQCGMDQAPNRHSRSKTTFRGK